MLDTWGGGWDSGSSGWTLGRGAGIEDLHVRHLGAAGVVDVHVGHLGGETGVVDFHVAYLGGRLRAWEEDWDSGWRVFMLDTWEGGWDSGLNVGHVGHLGGRLG